MANPFQALGCALLMLGTASPAQDPLPDARERAIVACIEKLSSDSPEERDAALGELRKIGAEVVPLLKAALEKSTDAESRNRIKLLLSELDLPQSSTFFLGRSEIRDRGGARGHSVVAALKWLARHQDPDGSWRADRFSGRCAGKKCAGDGERDYDLGVSALSILAFLGAGVTADSRDELPDPVRKGRVVKAGEVVKSGLQWLLSQQDREGCIGERGMKYVYGHAIATLALAEAYGMTRAENLKVPTRKAVEFLLACQNPGKGWRYSAKCGDNDSSVSGWAVMALEVARFASHKIPKEASDGALAWFDEVTEQLGYFSVGYNAKATGKVFIPGKNEEFDHHETMSAAAILARILIQRRRTAPELGSQNLLMADLPLWTTNKVDFYYWHLGSLALFQADGPEGSRWEKWDNAILNALVPNQKTGVDGCQIGSWDPTVDRWGAEGGRVYAVALNALTLETPRRYPAVAVRNESSR